MKKIALVEDYADNREVIAEMLEDDYEVAAYGDGQNALAGLRESQPDLVILDIGLPDMDGDQVLEKMRTELGLTETPVIALTAHAMVGERERLLAKGFDEYLTKPILDDEVLLGAVERLLESRG